MSVARARPGAGSWVGVAFGIGVAAFAAYHQFKLPVVLPLLLERYGYERTLAGAFVSVYAVAGLLLSMWMARRVQRQGTVAPVLFAMALLIAGSLVSLTAPELGAVVLAGRALEGVAFAALAVAGPVIASVNAPPRQMGLVIGIVAGWIPVGQITATLLAHVGVPQLGWTFLWWAGVVGALLIAALTVQFQRSGRIVLQQHADDRRAAQAGIATRSRMSLWLVGAVFMIWSGQYFAFMTWLPQYLVERHGVEMRSALLGYLLPVLFVLAFNVLAGTWLRGGTRLGVLLIGSVSVQAVIWALLPLADATPLLGIALLVVYGCCAGITPTCLFAMPGRVLGPHGAMASGFGIIMTGRNLGVLIGPVLLAWLVGHGGEWWRAQATFAALMLVAVSVALVVTTRLPAARTHG